MASDPYLDQVKELVLLAVANVPASVYLFGSRAKGRARHRSDVDIAIEVHGEVPPLLFSDLSEALEESAIPYRVDLVDLRSCGEPFRQRVKSEGVVWRNYKPG